MIRIFLMLGLALLIVWFMIWLIFIATNKKG